MSQNQDLEHLRLLSVFHYVVAGLVGLFSLIPVVHLTVGIGLVTGSFGEKDPSGLIAGWFFIALASVFILCGLTAALCLVLAGSALAQHRRYTFCLVMAAVACVFMPFGTILGVFTLIVLMRDSVKALFAES
jgi:hypothetical protein